ncbi:MAG: hypothetical protein ABEJ91_02190 [Candidatus Nanohaloarchaea archaeon]
MVGERELDGEIGDVFSFYLNDAINGELDFLGREVPTSHGYGSIDVLGIDLDRPYAELVRVKTPSYEPVMAKIAELDASWEYEQPVTQEVSVDSDLYGGQYYMDEEATNSPVLKEFFDAVIQGDMFEMLDPVDIESLDL